MSYGERAVEFTGAKSARYTFKRDFMPDSFHRGVIVAALEATEARNPRVEAARRVHGDCLRDQPGTDRRPAR